MNPSKLRYIRLRNPRRKQYRKARYKRKYNRMMKHLWEGCMVD